MIQIKLVCAAVCFVAALILGIKSIRVYSTEAYLYAIIASLSISVFLDTLVCINN